MTEILVAAVDDHPLMLEGICAGITREDPAIRIVTMTGTVPELIAAPAGARVVLLDLQLRDGTSAPDDIALLVRLGYKVLVLTTETKPVRLRSAMDAGAIGILTKNATAEDTVEAIRAADTGTRVVSQLAAFALLALADGVPHIPPRQLEAFRLAALGLPRKKIATKMGIAQATVDEHLARTVDELLGTERERTNLVGAVSRAYELGVLGE